MKRILLVRIWESEKGTWGVFIDPDENIPFAVSLELPKKIEDMSMSCIPEGEYKCRLYFSPKFKKTVYLLEEVPLRKYIEIHCGNVVDDTEGCILIGEQFEKLYGKPAILRSRKAMKELKKRAGIEFKLKIKNFLIGG